MLDIQLLRQDINSIAEKLQTRGFNLDTETFTRLEQQRKQLQIRTEELQSKRNNLSKQIGALKGQGKHDEANQTMAEVAQIKTELEKVDQDYQTIQNQINNLILTIRIYHIVTFLWAKMRMTTSKSADSVRQDNLILQLRIMLI